MNVNANSDYTSSVISPDRLISQITAASNTHQAIQLQGFLKGQRAYGYNISLFKRANTGWHRTIIHD